MIKSMTGFGRDSIEESGRSFIVEVKSVNHRYLDLNVKMPRNLISIEDRVRRIISEKVSRGKVDVFITQNIYDKQDVVVKFNESIADSYLDCLKQIKDRYAVRDDISVSLIARFPEVVSVIQKEEDIEEIWNILSAPLKEAVSFLILMREKEGEKLVEDVIKRCNYIGEMVDIVSSKSNLVVNKFKEKLEIRLKDLLSNTIVDENRLAQELAIFVDKSNIDEEIVRLRSHICQIKETLNLQEPIGRKLDFIVQEMNREANTIASKANDLELVNTVLNIKNEIEKIREQVQNIE